MWCFHFCIILSLNYSFRSESMCISAMGWTLSQEAATNPLEILWTAVDPNQKAPTGLKPLGPIRISKKHARKFLVSNATLLVMIAIALFGLYFYNILN